MGLPRLLHTPVASETVDETVELLEELLRRFCGEVDPSELVEMKGMTHPFPPADLLAKHVSEFLIRHVQRVAFESEWAGGAQWLHKAGRWALHGTESSQLPQVDLLCTGGRKGSVRVRRDDFQFLPGDG